MYYDIHKTTSGYPQKYWWVAKGENHETLCSSEMLTSKQACVSTIKVLKADQSTTNVYDETGEVVGGNDQKRIRL